ncbi:MAG: cytochrome c biogenesis protein CcdA [Flavobacterium sp.]|nr:cytochrome c biogenesis protein CcdA [Flavobacterium sp.]
MKKNVFILLAFLAFINVNAQIIKPVKWTSRVEKVSETEFNLIFDGTIDDGWHVYSQFTPDGGSLPMEITYKNQKDNYKLIGKTAESKTKKVFSDVFEVDEIMFEKKVVLTQKVKIIGANVTKITAGISYQVCKQSCINDVKNFDFDIPKIVVSTAAPAVNVSTTASPEVPTAPVVVPKDTVKTEVVAAAKNVQEAPKTKSSEPVEEDRSIWKIFLWSFLGGLLATITPCVFPMIPMTVSFFLKQSVNKTRGKFNAFFYGFCIISICVLITLPFHLLEGVNRDVFSNISTNVYLNIFFFAIFVIFAISFFGAYEIALPNKFANKVDNASNAGGNIGIFFMALTLIIVSFSCIGPALGFVLGTSLNSDGGAMILSLAMLGFGLGLALPFMFFAFAPSLLGNLPKSGGWLNTVKVVFGFVELALAFKFLSNADLVLQTHFLEREVFIAIWIAVFAVMALYLFGKITMPHDSPMPFISVGRMLFGLVTLAFAVYLTPGLWGAPLKLVSAFVPPMTYSESPNGVGATNTTTSVNAELPIGAVPGPLGIVSFEDYSVGLAYAKKVNKPVMIDFTGKACQNCRLMESNVWSDERVLKILKNDVVLISLYGDLRTPLPESERYISKEGNEINNIGQKWSEFQRLKYGTNARPYYVLMNLDETNLNTPVPYTPDVEEYLNWLTTGIGNFKK